jgi:hypothetical protein
MSITIGARTYDYLLAQPYGYEDKDVTAGLVARRFKIGGLLTASEWALVISDYNAWLAVRITEPDSVAANSIGTTVAFSSSEAVTVSSLACWYAKSPEASPEGSYYNVTVELVDAAQKLAAELKAKEKNEQDIPDLGTYTLGGCTVTLLKAPDGFQDVPQIKLTAAGKHYIDGTLGATETKAIEGRTTPGGWDALRSWYSSTVASAPTTGGWYPISAPTAKAENAVKDGLKIVRYEVQINLVKIR